MGAQLKFTKCLCKNFTVRFCKRKSLNQLSKVLIKSTLLLKVSTQVLKVSFNKKRTAVMASHIKTQLTQISTSAGGTHRDLADKYKVVLEAILKAFIEAIVNENVSLVISRQLLTDVATELVKIEGSVSKAVSHFTLEVVQPRVISFEE